MTEEVRLKIIKVQELVNNGVDGEKESAKMALDRLMKKYNISESDLNSISVVTRTFKYTTNIEKEILFYIYAYFTKSGDVYYSKGISKIREVTLKLNHLDYIVIESAYEYFRRHVKQEYDKLYKVEREKYELLIQKMYAQAGYELSLKTLRSNKEFIRRWRKRKEQIDIIFLNEYVRKSNLIGDHLTESKDKEFTYVPDTSNVQGGEYNTQINNNIYLE